MTKAQLLSIVRPFGQEHLLAFWDKLDGPARESLARQIEAIDFALVRRLFEGRNEAGNVRELAARAEPPPAFRLNAAENPFSPDEAPCWGGSCTATPVRERGGGSATATPRGASENPFSPQQARRRAEESLAAGQLGTILVAGGQGTRLGFEHPKGMFPIGPVSNKMLFQIFVEKIVAAGRRYGVRIPLYLMTSAATHDETLEFFAAHERFGLPEEDLIVFCQGTMPAVDAESGRVLLESPGRIATSPDGHGGMLAAMLRSGAIDDIERRGIRHLFYFQVDNPLVDICGREFVGYHLLAGSELSTQVIAKRDPLERVGNVVKVDGRLMVIEYSDLPDDAANRRNADGSLSIWAGSIAVHVIAAELLRRTASAADGLPFHIARKKVACLDAAGNRIEPAQPNAIKFERFIFDLMPQARDAIVVEVDPALAFGPVKNASGAKSDTPEIARAMLSALHRGWLREAGVEVDDNVPVEISPLYALDAEALKAKVPAGTRIGQATYFG
jgi:UDP-N-acetylglucosamine/UDP-N-acetylgalactosamine diphosphorylase